jgi:hypothetical protein
MTPGGGPSPWTIPIGRKWCAMTVRLEDLRPGDVLLTHSEGWGSWLIRLQAFLSGKPSLHNHIAIFTHVGVDGVPRGLEGRPGGFGWRDLRGYLDAPATISNAWQPGRTDEDRRTLVATLTEMVGTPYDFEMFAMAGAELFDRRAAELVEADTEWPEGHPPSHVVCSSVLDWGYEDRRWENPGGLAVTRWTKPADWTALVVGNRWHLPPRST